GDVLRAHIAGPREQVLAALRAVEGVVDVAEDGGGSDTEVVYTVTAVSGEEVHDRVARCVVDGGFRLKELRNLDLTLEDIFLHLTTETEEEVKV
ncbi:uncharacterized protein METZ01_LOCUS331190, partial [marine metagenome]